MNDLWLKIKLWTKVIVTSVVAIFFLVFLFENSNIPVHIWLWNQYDTTLLKLIFYVFLGGFITAFMAQTTIKTLYQFRTLRARAATARAEQQLADLKKAQAAAASAESAPIPLSPAPSQPASNPQIPSS